MAFSANLGAIRHQANATQINYYKLSYSGRAAEVIYWFKDLRAKATELAGRVSQVDIPTLVFWGELDVMFDPSNAEHLNNALTNSKLRILPEVGHLSWADQPDFFAAMLIDWIERQHSPSL